MRAFASASLLLGALLLAGCSGTTTTTTQPTTAVATTTAPAMTMAMGHDHAVSISGFKFSPGTLTIPVGDSVTWTNSDSEDHTATDSDEHGFDTGTIHQGAASSPQPFPVAGTYAYHCTIHPSMTATITVQ